ncbi:MAG: PKD domain-containing protein [bacterium]|nr:PKD domain-containing protein [bacterium]
MLKKIVLVAVIIASSISGYAQEMYFSISGTNVEVASGDERNQYDIWIKPSSAAQGGSIQIFDAGLGGAVDLITQESANTSTNFALFNFDDVYTPNGNSVVSKNSDATALTNLVTTDEERFKNRWVPLSNVEGTGNGYIIRVSADDGDDVNSFNFRVVSSTGQILGSDSWKIIAIDLSIGVYGSNQNTVYQLQPYFADNDYSSPALRVNGEEDSEVRKIDSFGNTYEASETELPFSNFGLTNTWGIQLSGSDQWLNTLTIYGVDQPVLWEFNPIALSGFSNPELSISEVEATTACTDKTFELSGADFSNSDLNRALWILNNSQLTTGSRPTISFEDRGQIPLEILIPNDRSYYPEYWAYQQIVFVNTPPVAELSAPKQILSPSEELLLDASESYDLEGQEIEYTWFVNGTRRGSGPTFRFSNTVSGVYNIAVQVSDGGTSVNCSIAEESVEIRVNTQPYAEIIVPAVSGTDEPITITVQNASDSDNDNLTYNWAGLGVPPNSSGSSITVQHAQPGVYPVRLTIDDNTGSRNATFTVNRVYEINAAPEPNFSMPENIAPGDIVTLNALESSDPNVDDLAYTWSLNGQIIASSEITTLSLDEPGDYNVTLTVDDQRGASNSSQSLTQVIHVNAPPTPIISAVPITSKANVEFAANQSTDLESDIQSYLWDFGDGNRASGPQVSHTYQSTGTYTVKLTVDDGASLANSVQTSEHVIVVNSYPIASFFAPTVVGPGERFTVDGTASTDAEGEISSYEWIVNGAPTTTGPQASLELESPGLHTVGLTVTDNSGFDEAKGFSAQQIRVNEPPVARWRTEPVDLVPNTEIKFIADLSFDNDGEIERYIWRFDDGTEIRGETIQRFFEDGGQKNFTLTVVDNDGVSNSSTSVNGVVNVNHQPYIVTESMVRSNSLDVRLDASESYDLDNDALIFEWTLPDGSKRQESAFTWKAPDAGVHIIGLTVSDGLSLGNSSVSESITVMVNRPVEAVVDSVISSCTGQRVLFNSSQSFDPDGDAFRVKWDFGNGMTSEEANPTHVYETPGVYEARLTLDDGFSGMPSIAKIPVIIEGSPVAKFALDETTVCVNSAIQLDGSLSTDPSGSLPSFSWDLGDGNTATGAKYQHVFTEPGTYTITLTVEGSGSGQCGNTSQTTAEITVIEGPEASFDLPDWVAPGEPVILDGSESFAQGGFKNAKWIIDTENGSQELDGLTATHIFNEPGEYFVTLNLETNAETDCNTVSLTKSINVNAPPVISWQLPENVPAGSDLRLDALNSNDPDGFIRQFKWYVDDGFVSYNASEIIKAITPGRHKVTLEVTDNSNAANNFQTIEKYFFANSSPKPTIEAPAVVYQNQTVNLRSGLAQDADGDILSTRWKLDGEFLPTPTFIASEAKTYRITLIQDDGRGLENSVDSTVMAINPIKVPSINPYYPTKLALGGALSVADMNIGQNWAFKNQNFFESTWRPSTAGETTFTLAWTPQGRALGERSFPITVVDPLQFTEQATPIILEWNPTNPTTILTAPKVNRQTSDVKIEWKRNGEVIGQGLQISPELIRGQNRFTVEVTDLKVAQSRPITVDLIVTTQ